MVWAYYDRIDSHSFHTLVQLIGYGTDPMDGDYWLTKNYKGEMVGDGWKNF
jgi:hypothetical protein